MKKLEGKVAIVTGGASGIGEATARQFADHGALVVIADIQDEKGREVAESIGSNCCRYIHCDVTDEDQVKAMVDSTVATFGHLNIMFSNAGIVSSTDQTVLDLDLSDFDRVLAVNTRGMAACVKHAARAMVERRVRGSIVCTASMMATRAGSKRTDYVMSKYAVIGLVRSASKQLGVHGIRVNCVSPSAVATPMFMNSLPDAEVAKKVYRSLTSLKGIDLTVGHVANAVLFLASDDAAFITGHDLAVDGGLTKLPDVHKTIYLPVAIHKQVPARSLRKTNYMKKLEGKIAIVTGGASGIGEATARHFAEHGAHVIIGDIQDEKGEGVAKSIGSNLCSYIHCDVTVEDQVKSMVDWTLLNFGRLDIMFSNAGVNSNSGQTILNLNLSEFNRVFSVNVNGMVACVKHAARAMVESRVRGSIVCTASVMGTMGTDGMTDYTMSKHAVIGLVRSASKQLGVHGIRVNSVSPSAVATPMIVKALPDVEVAKKAFRSLISLKGNDLTVGNIADAVLFLASNDSAFITGHDLVVDGGLTKFPDSQDFLPSEETSTGC